jgi:hypothetical protein
MSNSKVDWPSRPNWTLEIPPSARNITSKLPKFDQLPFDYLQTAFISSWVYEPVQGRIPWANLAALDLWDAESLEALQVSLSF